MDQEELTAAIADLDRLAELEYRQSLREVVERGDDVYTAVRLGRLIGVMLKQPFAQAVEVSQASARTGAYRAWMLVPSEDEFERRDRVSTWQYAAMREIQNALAEEDPVYGEWTAFQFANRAQNEEGFFGFFARAVRRYVCGDQALREEVEASISRARKSGASVADISPEMLVASGGAALGSYLVAAVPVLGYMGVPTVAALMVILYRLGAEGFCQWTENLREPED